jgi:hypothetical protein
VLVQNNADGSVTVFYSTLDDMIASVIAVSKARRQPVSVLNVHGHGLPGGMWFPPDQATMESPDCADWKQAATGSDQANYNQYYSAVSVEEINEIRMIADMPGVQVATCTTGIDEWKAEVAKAPAFKSVFAPDAQIHFLSCVVGLGQRGLQFTQGIADLLLQQGGKGRVEASMDFGLGDWSLPEGMGYWDMQSEEQVNHDNDIYVKDRKDREIMQKGTTRMISYGTSGWQSTLLANQDFLKLGFEPTISGIPVPEPTPHVQGKVPTRIRIVGTQYYANVK